MDLRTTSWTVLACGLALIALAWATVNTSTLLTLLLACAGLGVSAYALSLLNWDVRALFRLKEPSWSTEGIELAAKRRAERIVPDFAVDLYFNPGWFMLQTDIRPLGDVAPPYEFRFRCTRPLRGAVADFFRHPDDEDACRIDDPSGRVTGGVVRVEDGWVYISFSRPSFKPPMLIRVKVLATGVFEVGPVERLITPPEDPRSLKSR